MARLSLNYQPRQWQLSCHTQLKRFNILVLHRRAGKTVLACMHLIRKALEAAPGSDSLFAYLAPFLKQSKQVAWPVLKRQLRPLIVAGVVEVKEGELALVFTANGARIQLFGADNADAMRGLRLDEIVIDEVAQIRPEVWDQIVQPALSDRMGGAVFIGTVSGVDLLSQLYFDAEGQDDWFRALFTVYDTEALDPEEVERLRRTMTATAFAREFLCDFTASADDQLISLADAIAAGQRHVKEQDIAFAPRIMGVDVARFGNDRSSIAKRQGVLVHDVISLRGIDNMSLAARVANEIEAFKPHAVFIDAGGGQGVIDRLRQLHYDVIEVPFGGTALNQRYKNRRTEMWWSMREWLVSGGVIPNTPQLRQELATPTYSFDPSGKIALESKDEIKKRLRGNASPDEADAVALTFASPVAAGADVDLGGYAAPKKPYDPFADLI